ncbi:MAG: XdhC family protein [Crocinitomicaceae bacterium]|nr:XdhC family protein [Crocinitomicaceae bacterium]
MKIWQSIKSELSENQKIILMYVLESHGSSPGRQGFKMMVSDSGRLSGSIGGGFMEHKLVELCRKELLSKDFDPFFKKQVHKADVPKNKSGMICSGEQTIAFYLLKPSDLTTVEKILTSGTGVLEFNQNGIEFLPDKVQDKKFELNLHSETSWTLREDLHHFPVLHVVGGGHVSLALSKFAHELGFEIKIYDDREGLNTVEQNNYGEFIPIDDYENIGESIPPNPQNYVVLVSFGYRTDKIILKGLIDHEFKYLGMMGSEEKVKQLYQELSEEGVDQDKLDKVYSPIGVQIFSKTPEEIAISILAEIVRVKNT